MEWNPNQPMRTSWEGIQAVARTQVDIFTVKGGKRKEGRKGEESEIEKKKTQEFGSQLRQQNRTRIKWAQECR